jgi:hypothetical protein
LVDDDIDPEILERGIKVLLDDLGEAVDFVDEENITLLEAGEESGEVTGFFNRRSGSGPDGGVHFRSKNVGEGGLAQAGRPAEKKMVKRLGAGAGGIEQNGKPFAKLGLAGKIGETTGPKGLVDGIPRTGFGVQLVDGLRGHEKQWAEKAGF